jgi:peptide-methionine (S)-S-oxide reductase
MGNDSSAAAADGPHRPDPLDADFRAAVAAIDAGDVGEVERLLAARPALARERLRAPGAWLREQVGDTLDGYFREPYLLWFVADNPIRAGRLPANIADVARTLAAAAKGAPSYAEQVDYALELVVTGRVPREAGVLEGLIDVLLDAGASPEHLEGAMAERNHAAVARLIDRGAAPTLASALFLGRWEDAQRLARTASARDRQVALATAALDGNAEALRFVIPLGVDVSAYSTAIHPHATAIHHAVGSGSLDAVRVLADAGADLTIRDRAYGGTPLGWAEHLGRHEIAAFLRQRQSA